MSEKATPLFKACYRGDTSSVRQLLERGADPNERSFVNLQLKNYFDNDVPQEIGSLLLSARMAKDANPSIYVQMEYGFTNLYYPALHNDEQIVRLLLEAGADPNGRCFNGLFPLYVAAEVGNLNMVKDLIRYGAYVNSTTPRQSSSLINAAEEGHTDVALALLEAGANLWYENAYGHNAIQAASRCGRTTTFIALSSYRNRR